MNSATSSTISQKHLRLGEKSAESLSRGTEFLMHTMRDNHWCFELEADVTIPSEYIFLQRILKRNNLELEAKIGAYLRRRQNVNGSWALYEDGPGDMSATVKAYFALKLMGHSIDDIHMVSARKWVLQNGGAETVNVFTRITLALFGQLSWKTVPAMPVEMMFLPKWWFFHLSKVSYWSRCVIVPLLVIFAKRPVYETPIEQSVSELFTQSPSSLTTLDKINWRQPVNAGFVLLDRGLKFVNNLVPRFIRERALAKAERWTREHCSGDGGIGGIFQQWLMQ
jgi:squalene-hopene/tetraprenyl-beta-curcumene cyclase